MTDEENKAFTRLTKALEKISRWHEKDFPETRRFWLNGDQMTYSEAYGPTGEINYMRHVAKDALYPRDKEPYGS